MEAAKEQKTVEATQLVEQAKQATTVLKQQEADLTQLMDAKKQMVQNARTHLDKVTQDMAAK